MHTDAHVLAQVLYGSGLHQDKDLGIPTSYAWGRSGTADAKTWGLEGLPMPTFLVLATSGYCVPIEGCTQPMSFFADEIWHCTLPT